MIPIADAATRLGRSPWTLKRMFKDGHLPVVIMRSQWFVPESFIAAVLASPAPARAGVLEEIACGWFAAHSATA